VSTRRYEHRSSLRHWINSATLHSHCAYRITYESQQLAYTLDSLVRVQDGSDKHPKLKRRRPVYGTVQEHNANNNNSKMTEPKPVTPQTINHLHCVCTLTKRRSTTIMSYRRLIGWGSKGLKTNASRLPPWPLNRQTTGRDVLQEKKCGLLFLCPTPYISVKESEHK